MAPFGNTDKIENLSERRELSDAAKALLADKAFDYAWTELRKRWFAELILLPHACPQQDEVAAKLRALNAIAEELAAAREGYRNDLKMKARHA
jgi:hypothetical protein